MIKWWYNANMGKKENKETNKKISANKITAICAIAAVVISIISPIISYQSSINTSVARLDESNEGIKELINQIKESDASRMDEMSKRIDAIDERIAGLTDKMNELSRDLGVAEGKIEIIPLRAEGQVGAAVMSFSYVKNDDVFLSKPSFSEGVVAIGLDDKEYSAKDLQNQPIIIPYMENGQEVFFQGQFNENNQWDGECLINVYQDGVFVIATEATYDNGKRKEYQQLFPNGDEWVYSKRIDQDTFNGGDTWTYEKITDGKQTISFENPNPADMIRPSEVEYESGADLISHYHGNTSDGKYNDDSGEAYLIEYYEDGYTRLVYQGKFANGLQEDNTGNAWQIARNKVTGTDYMLYKGVFEAGKQTHKDGEVNDWENPLSSTKLKQYTEGKPFEDELHFDMEFIVE